MERHLAMAVPNAKTIDLEREDLSSVEELLTKRQERG
jgi:hypothetical protein